MWNFERCPYACGDKCPWYQCKCGFATDAFSPSIVNEARNLVFRDEVVQNIFNMFAYHITPQKINNYGLLSPEDLLKKSPELFHKYSYEIYKNRAMTFLKKTKITDEDILYYLNNCEKRKPLSAKSIFFSFIPRNKCRYLDGSGFEYKIIINNIQEYSKSSPCIVRGCKILPISWKNFLNEYENFIVEAENGAIRDPGNDLSYKLILHFAVDCDPIPQKYLKLN